MKIAIAGATGFIGMNLIDKILEQTDHTILGLGRTVGEHLPHFDNRISWRLCDMFSLSDCQNALRDADMAIYLVHSMMPSAHLSQGKFEDFDLICAENFAMAAEENNLKHIVYLSGLIPDERPLSLHLESRLEVEKTLGLYKTPVTTLRAGLIIGPGGSSYRILNKLVKRLPLMILPKWTNTKCRPIALQDIIRGLMTVVRDVPEGKVFNQTRHYDTGGPDVLTYRDMIKEQAQVLKTYLLSFSLPVLTPGLSKLWISLVTGASYTLVSPLIESLQHSMVGDEKNFFPWSDDHKLLSYRESLELAEENATPRMQQMMKRRKNDLFLHDVRSIQKLDNPKKKSAEWLAREYMHFLTQYLKIILTVRIKDEQCTFYLLKFIPLLHLQLSKERSSERRRLFYIVGGILHADNFRGRLEIRVTKDKKKVLTAIHDFSPFLPWFIYKFTQAPIHAWVMRAFGRHLLDEQTYVDKTD